MTPTTPATAESFPEWEGYAPMIPLVLAGELDGFFVEHENTFKYPSAWPDGQQVHIYKSPRGKLLFRPSAWAHYGHANEGLFRRSVRARKVRCKTWGGILSLGGARMTSTGDLRVLLAPSGGCTQQGFMVVDQEEAEVVIQHLARIFPDRPAVVAAGGFGGALAASGILDMRATMKMIREVPPRWVTTMVMLSLLALASLLACIGAGFGYLPSWVLTVVTFLFPLAIMFALLMMMGSKEKAAAVNLAR